MSYIFKSLQFEPQNAFCSFFSGTGTDRGKKGRKRKKSSHIEIWNWSTCRGDFILWSHKSSTLAYVCMSYIYSHQYYYCFVVIVIFCFESNPRTTPFFSLPYTYKSCGPLYNYASLKWSRLRLLLLSYRKKERELKEKHWR